MKGGKGLISLWVVLAFLGCWLPMPSEAGLSVLGDLSYEKQARPGESYRGAISLMNTGQELLEVKLFQRDYLFYHDGRNLYGDPGRDARSNAAWIDFSPKRLAIPPKQTSQVNYLVNVPNEPSLTGTYWSLLMVEPIGKSSPEAVRQEKGKASFGINVVMNYGIQLVTHMGESGSSDLRILDAKLVRQEGQRMLQVDLENTGERMLRSLVWTELFSQGGAAAGRFEGQQFRMYPGTSARFKIDLSSVPIGSYRALVIADCGGDLVFGATYNLEFQ